MKRIRIGMAIAVCAAAIGEARSAEWRVTALTLS